MASALLIPLFSTARQAAGESLQVREDILDDGSIVGTLADGKEYTAKCPAGFDLLYARLSMMRSKEVSMMESDRAGAA